MQSDAEHFNRPLFGSEADWWHDACIDSGGQRWDAYASGYKEAADILIAHLIQSQGTLDTVIYPLLFLYRQYIELRLKHLVRGARELAGTNAPTKLDHRLLPLWSELRRTLESLWPDETPEVLDKTEHYLNEFSKVDPESVAFRYPESRNGTPALSGVSRVNVRHVAAIMSEIAILLEGVSGSIGEYLQYQRDMDADAFNGY